MTSFAFRLAAAAAFIAAPLLAQTAPNVHVRYSDLDLSKPEGAKRLDRRIAAAAEALCPAADRMRLDTVTIARRCRAEVLGRAKAQVEVVVAAAQSRQRLAAADTVVRPAGL